MNFFEELKRRSVYRVGAAYVVVAWLLIQVATQTFPFFEIPNWIVRSVILLLCFGFPVALVLAWAFDLTPAGLRRTESDQPRPAPARGRAWIYIVVIGALLSLGLFFAGRYTAPDKPRGSPERSLAVLPFENLSEDKSNAYFPAARPSVTGAKRRTWPRSRASSASPISSRAACRKSARGCGLTCN